MTAPPGLANVPAKKIDGTSFLRRSHTDKVMVDSGAGHSAGPSDRASEHKAKDGQQKIQFQTASGELFEHHGEKLVPHNDREHSHGHHV